MRTRPGTRLYAVLIMSLAFAAACASPAVETTPEGLSGLTLVYRFPIGRLYRASYGDETVEFALLEPRQPEAPCATLPYRARTIRPGLYLVVWEGDPRFHSTFLVDLERRELHASSLRGNDQSFFGTAAIEEIRRRD